MRVSVLIVVLCALLGGSLSACELVADFDRSKLAGPADAGGDGDASAGAGGVDGSAGNDASAGSGGSAPDDDAGDDDAGQ